MGYRAYTVKERIRMAEIYADCGGDGPAIPAALAQIERELGIKLNKYGRSLRDWARKYGIEPKKYKPAVPVLFGETAPAVSKQKFMSMDEYRRLLETFAADDYKSDRELLKEVYNELKSGRVRDSLKTKSPEELLRIKDMIESAQQRREAHLIRVSEYVDIKTTKPVDLAVNDDAILEEMEEANAS